MTNGHYICIMRRKIYREDILAAGLELMFLNGYNATGIKDITDRVEIPKGSFYNHFGSKEEFGLEVVSAYCKNGLELYNRSFIQSTLPPLDRFEAFFDTLILDYQQNLNCKLGCVMSNFAAEMADVNEHFQKLLDKEFSKCQDIMRQCLDLAREQGDLKSDLDSDELASYVLNGWHGALIRMKATASDKPLKNFRNLTMQLLRT